MTEGATPAVMEDSRDGTRLAPVLPTTPMEASHRMRTRKMQITTFATGAWLALLSTMATAQTVSYDYNRAANFSKYRTYAWSRGAELADELVHARIVRAIDGALAGKGLTRVEPGGNPDVLVAYHTSFDRNLEINGFLLGWGPFDPGGDRRGSATVQPVLVGTLVVDITDAREGRIVWRGLASSDIRPGEKPQSRDKKIAKATEKMFRNYPPKP